MAKTQAIHVEREKALEDLGIMVDKDVSYHMRTVLQKANA
jgi:hypothetical protein